MSRRRSAFRVTRDDDPLAVFVRGATVGVFVGAVIAGSTIWRRLQRSAAGSPPTAVSPPDDPGPPAARATPPRRAG